MTDQKLYTGVTNNIERRIKEHNLGSNFSTKGRGPFKLIYCEVYRHRDDAAERERFLKTGWGRQYVKRVLKNYLQGEKFRRG